jgi:hypothetical protein
MLIFRIWIPHFIILKSKSQDPSCQFPYSTAPSSGANFHSLFQIPQGTIHGMKRSRSQPGPQKISRSGMYDWLAVLSTSFNAFHDCLIRFIVSNWTLPDMVFCLSSRILNAELYRTRQISKTEKTVLLHSLVETTS